jgi:CRP/FNR family transcriptional regulator, cyclic AMP receptor protein
MDYKTAPSTKITAFFAQKQSRMYKKGEMILQPGDPVDNVYYVNSGYVRLYCIVDSGNELTLNIFKPGSYFPMFLVLDNAPNQHYFQAMTTAKLTKVPKDDIMHFIKGEPEVLLEFTRRLSAGLNGLITNIQYTLFGPVHARIISALLFLSKRFGEKLPDGSVRISLPLTHQDIANVIGIARETASLEMEKLAKKKLVSDKQKRITIYNIPLLEQEALIDEETQVTDYSL